ncbi:hypothetical protein ACGGKE_16100 (plasmid) [Sphingobium naphthae]|uniref:hypothetical protein n=1 Tax=Sphingobium naphthae TaxID=1886786 RepID=UPI00374A5E1A
MAISADFADGLSIGGGEALIEDIEAELKPGMAQLIPFISVRKSSATRCGSHCMRSKSVDEDSDADAPLPHG